MAEKENHIPETSPTPKKKPEQPNRLKEGVVNNGETRPKPPQLRDEIDGPRTLNSLDTLFPPHKQDVPKQLPGTIIDKTNFSSFSSIDTKQPDDDKKNAFHGMVESALFPIQFVGHTLIDIAWAIIHPKRAWDDTITILQQDKTHIV